MFHRPGETLHLADPEMSLIKKMCSDSGAVLLRFCGVSLYSPSLNLGLGPVQEQEGPRLTPDFLDYSEEIQALNGILNNISIAEYVLTNMIFMFPQCIITCAWKNVLLTFNTMPGHLIMNKFIEL